MENKITVGIFGITGAVGTELLNVLYDKKFPIKELRCFASKKSAGKKVKIPTGEEITIEDANEVDYSTLDLAYFAIGGGWPKENAKKATDAGCIVIDNSSTFRYDDSVSLVVPEINPEMLKDAMLIANPNCTTAIAAIPLWVLHKKYILKKVIMSTYQAVSGAGMNGISELTEQTKNYLDNKEVSNQVFQHPISFNIIPHIDDFQENGYTKEEMKVVWETQKIFNDKNIKISSTCVRVPVMRAHCESIVVETEKEISVMDVNELLSKTDGVTVYDDVDENVYPMPLVATKKYDVYVGRIRNSIVFDKNGLEFFVSGDQILKGAALNAVQIGLKMYEMGRFSNK